MAMRNSWLFEAPARSGALGTRSPALRRVPSPPASRPCCILAPTFIPFISDSNLVDRSSLGKHRRPGEGMGLIYTGRAGFVDLGQLRALSDLARFVWDQILPLPRPRGHVVRTIHGTATLAGRIDSRS